MNQTLETIKQRRSIRGFKPDPLPRELVVQLLEAATWAPNAGNLQPWEFYVVTDPATRVKAGAAARQRFVSEAPVLIVVCALPLQSAEQYGARGEHLYCLQDTAAAVQNILLAATSLGLATCWVGSFNENSVAESLNLEPGRRPVAMIPVGYAASKSRAPARKPLEAVTRWI